MNTALAKTDDDRSINAFSSAEAFETAQRMAKALSMSTLVPQEYRGNLPNVMIAMELAARIGASPFAVMQNLDIIHGRPSFRSTFLIATINACGRFSPLRFRFSGDEGSSSWGCRAYATDQATGEECVGALITIGLAKAEGWLSKKGSKWQTMPEQMLMYRSAAFWTRVYAPELSLGMHTREEVDDIGNYKISVEPDRAGSSSLAQKLTTVEAVEAVEATPDVEAAPEAPEEYGTVDPPADFDDAPSTEHDGETGEVYGA